METLAELNYQKTYEKIKNRQSFSFLAKREELNFQDIERSIPNFDFELPFDLPILNSLDDVITLLLQDSVGQINVNLLNRIKMLVTVFNGKILYQKIEDGITWEVIIIFPVIIVKV